MSNHYSTDRYERRKTLPDPTEEFKKEFRALVYGNDERIDQLSEVIHHAEKALMPMAETKEGRARIQRDIDGAITVFCKDIYQIVQRGEDYCIDDWFIFAYPKGYDINGDDENMTDIVKTEVIFETDPDYCHYRNLSNAKRGDVEYDHPKETDYEDPWD